MGAFSIWHWLIVLAIVVLVFGTKKLRNLGGDLGGALKGFKQGIKDSETEEEVSSSRSSQMNSQKTETVVKEREESWDMPSPLPREKEQVIEGEVKDKTEPKT